MPDFQIPAVMTVDVRRAPLEPIAREKWVRGRQIDQVLLAAHIDVHDIQNRALAGTLVKYRERRAHAMQQARQLRAAGHPPDAVNRKVREARSLHRVILRRLHGLRQIAAKGPR